MSEIANDKIAALQNIILEHANQQREALASDARKEAEQWLAEEMSKLERETNAVLADAKTGRRTYTAVRYCPLKEKKLPRLCGSKTGFLAKP
jgi:cell division septum initiation protein DivIVA